MSVPLPSPSPLTVVKPIPHRPSPINLDSSHHDKSHRQALTATAGGADLASSPGSYRRPSVLGSASAKSAGLGVSPGSGPNGAGGDNWRDRNGKVGSFGAGVNANASAGASAGASASARAPERTVGGFEKKEARDAKSASTATTNGDNKPAALAHVPCRFFKAGACTAGSSCPFSHEEGGKKEVCQWFLKGNCKFGHKCALAHVRPGEPMSMDRKNKKEQQREARERADGKPTPRDRDVLMLEEQAAPVPIRSALSTSMQSPPVQKTGMGSSPMREPYGPPPAAIAGSPSAGFLARSPGTFAASPNRPSPLSSSFTARGGMSLKSAATTSIYSALRPPITAAPAGFSSSFSHTAPAFDRTAPVPLSASFADGTVKKSIWARSETPDEPLLSPARRPIPPRVPYHADVFDDDDDHGEDLIPSSLSDLLTPMERARRMSRRDSADSGFGASPGSGQRQIPPMVSAGWGGERLAQSAGANMGPGNFLQSLWSAEGGDARRLGGENGDGGFAFGPDTAAPQPRQSLLSSSRTPSSPHRTGHGKGQAPAQAHPIGSPHRMQGWTSEDAEPPFFSRAHDPSSPSARALQEHAPGQSLPGGVATALSRLHLHGPRPSSGLAHASTTSEEGEGEGATPPLAHGHVARKEEHEEGVFTMDG